ncbi:MAG: HAD family phosphatase [Clostridia bacterium]|nr:HAD family phosphatase [Clostridia bacterium]
MIKLAVFDLDGTLCDYGKGVLAEDIALLKQIAAAGVKIAICSGKPVFYLCGFCRQLGLEDVILIGENGGSMQFGIALPPTKFYTLSIPQETKKRIAFFESAVKKAVPGIWCQPNEIEFSPFPQTPEEFAAIENIIAAHPEQLTGITLIRHPDCFDFIPEDIHKGNALKSLAKELALSPDEMLAVGNAENDYPMFDFCGTAIGINMKDESKVNHNFPNLTTALTYIKNELI